MTGGPKGGRAGVLRSVAAMGIAAGALHAGSSAFSVSCPAETPCVPLSDLVAGAPLPEAIHVLDRRGAAIADVAGPLRWALPEDGIPELISDAFVAVEDRRFWEHGGIDVRGVGRALVRNVSAGHIEEGASTIPMQLVRTLWGESLRAVGPWRRKIIEARTAPLLVRKLGHRRVLTLYVNAIYLGNGVYGVDAAARYYFGVPAWELDLAQVATLVGMTRSPELLEPRRHPGRAKTRRDVVLGVLAAEGVVSAAEARRAQEQAVSTTPEASEVQRRSHLTAAVTRELRDVAPELAGRPGLRAITAIDSVVQSMGEVALAEQLALIERGAYGPFHADSTEVLEGAAVAVDPSSGAVRAWIGGRDFRRSEFDRVSQARRQVGSLIKPFIVATALEQRIGILDLVSTLAHRPGDTDEPAAWMPADHVEDPVLPIREALIRSSNRAAINLGGVVGVEAVRAVSRDSGIEGPIPDLPSSFIGAFEASLLEMTGAYAVFGNGGVRVSPYLIERLEDGDSTVLWTHPASTPLHALDAATSYVVLDALRAVVERGTGAPVRAVGFTGAAAGKTGTTNEGKDAWFIGLIPDLAAGVWIGFDRPRRVVPRGSGGTLAGPAWGRWMARIGGSTGSSGGDWPPPSGVHPVRYDPRSGETASAACSSGPTDRYVVAYVRDAEYSTGGCPGYLTHWLKSMWRTLVPRTPPSLPERKRSGGGDRR